MQVAVSRSGRSGCVGFVLVVGRLQSVALVTLVMSVVLVVQVAVSRSGRSGCVGCASSAGCSQSLWSLWLCRLC